ncbi:hypothetical protein ACLB90_16310 [Stenotrophomonas sp. LGBM10]|uniref:hypothetical protein n=1 Tax=Stenotrophomonas sp. LGBM10 TaxID=3390038 RepID=UPI00398A7E9C
MTRRRSAPLLALSLIASLAAPTAFCAPDTPLRITLRVVDACRLPSGAPADACPAAHQRSSDGTPPPAQVQALAPRDETAPPGPDRAWPPTFIF